MNKIKIKSERDYLWLKAIQENIRDMSSYEIAEFLKDLTSDYEKATLTYNNENELKHRVGVMEKTITEKNHYIDTLLKTNMRLRQEQTKYNKGLLEVRSVEYDRAIAQKALELAIEVIRYQEIDGRNYYEVIKDYYRHFTSKPEDLILSNFDIEIYFVDMAKEMIEYDN